MKLAKAARSGRQTLLDIDDNVRRAFTPYRHSAPVNALSRLSELGDQPQMRLICAGLLAAGLLRSDVRMVRAGGRMLASHELATLAKNFIKRRVDRSRPRSADGNGDEEPRPGRQTGKEETSFPSGHSAGAMSVASAFAAEYPEYTGPAYAAAGAVALAQIPRCAHYPTDVGAGLLIGAGAQALVGLALRAAGLGRRS